VDHLTYDRPWYQHIKSFLQNKGNWKTLEFYAIVTKKGYEIPLIDDNTDPIQKSSDTIIRRIVKLLPSMRDLHLKRSFVIIVK